ncbi:MAG: prepilin-type N-terminal cleavage/methylation domain-containing protein [Gemmataceae bacterium]|nr:prepilin-type N-terminal cleavage/methylation domain-containing protein [Gemmataceae bacterium]
MRIRQGSRPGVTLVEVLAAIFIMGVGMLAVLVLYPLGALRMAAALKDGRCGVIAANVDSISSMFDLRDDPAVTPYFAAGYTPPGYAPADPLGRGYPVLVDPYYALSGYGTIGTSSGSPGIPRVTPKFVRTALGPLIQRQDCERWFTFLDDLTFDPDGSPKVAGAALERQWKYTWSCLLKRFRAGDPQTTELTVVVYRGRPISQPVPEETYQVPGPRLQPGYAEPNVGDTSIVVRWPVAGPAPFTPQEKPALRRGAWVLDTTYKLRSQVGGAGYGYVHAEFYKVLQTSEEPGYYDPETQISYSQMRLDIQPPLRDANVSQLTVLEGAVEVFERGNGRK